MELYGRRIGINRAERGRNNIFGRTSFKVTFYSLVNQTKDTVCAQVAMDAQQPQYNLIKGMGL